MAAWVFWGAMGLVAYAYGGYLLVLVLLDAFAQLRANVKFLSGLADRRGQPVPGTPPRVSVLIAAHNEAGCIREKIENTLALDYPADRLEILVGSDGSTDGTDDIVREYASRGVVLSAAPRGGKVSVLNRLARVATGELWLFTDANTVIAKDALKLLVRRFSDAHVGGVCGRLQLVSPNGAAAEEGAYWRYENLLKLYESRHGALMGANGGLYMLRRDHWRPLPADTIVDDFLATMRVLKDGHRLVYDPEALAVEETAADLAGEFKRRVRISAGNFQSLRELAPLLVRPDFAAFAFWSHKVLRWVAPFLLVLAFLASAVLALDSAFYGLLFAGQVAFYFAAWLARAPWGRALGRAGRLARYFVEMNVALVLGLVRLVSGRQGATWQRTARAPLGPPH